MTNRLPKMQDSEQINLSAVFTKRGDTDRYSVFYAPGVDTIVNNTMGQLQAASCDITRDPRLATGSGSKNLVETNRCLVNSTEIMDHDNNAKEIIIVFSASDARAWLPLGTARISLFESWTNFSWEPPVDRPGFADALIPIQFIPWTPSTQERAFISYDGPMNTIAQEYPIHIIKQHKSSEGLGNETHASDSFFEIAFQELTEAERTSQNITPRVPSDAILMHGSMHLSSTPANWV